MAEVAHTATPHVLDLWCGRRGHTTYVQKIARCENFPAGGFFAVCGRCGADPFPNRATLEEAEADAERHGRLQHVYEREDLVAYERG